MSLLVSFLVCSILYALPSHAAEFYVATDGSPTGDGSITRPWDLQTALGNRPPCIQVTSSGSGRHVRGEFPEHSLRHSQLSYRCSRIPRGTSNT